MSLRVRSCAAAATLIYAGAQANPVKQTSGPVQQAVEVSDGASQNTNVQCSAGWDNLPGASAKLTIPSGGNQLLTARFTAKGYASGPNPQTTVGVVRIVMGTREMLPIPVPPDIFGVTTINTYAPFALERSLLVAPGAHTVTVQYCGYDAVSNQANFQVWDWHLTVEAASTQ